MRFLKQRDTFSYPLSFSSNYKLFEAQKNEASLQNFKTEKIGRLSIMKNIRKELERNLSLIIPLMEAQEIVNDIFETLINPCIPMPNLRK